VAVTDLQVSVLRALLAGGWDLYQMLRPKLNREADPKGYNMLAFAAFVEAVNRQFAKDHSRSAIIQFVALARSRNDDTVQEIDPALAEGLILDVFEDSSLDEYSRQERASTRQFLLVALVHKATFNDRDLNAFLAKSRKLADHWLEQDDPAEGR
jgi:hypothetical protein